MSNELIPDMSYLDRCPHMGKMPGGWGKGIQGNCFSFHNLTLQSSPLLPGLGPGEDYPIHLC